MDVRNFERVKEMLCREMDEIAKQGEISGGTLATVDTLAHAIKNIDKIIMCDEDGYSGADDYSHDRNYSRGVDTHNGYSDRYSERRDSRGRYSRAGGVIVDKLNQMMEDAQDEREREALRRAVEMLK